MEIFISRKLQYGAAIMLVAIVTLMAGIVVGIRTAPEDPKEVLTLYIRLRWLSVSLDKMEGEVRERDEAIGRYWTAIRIEDRMKLTAELAALSQEYAETAGEYNNSMRQNGYRFTDPTKLPEGAKFGPLPRRYEPFILLKSGERTY